MLRAFIVSLFCGCIWSNQALAQELKGQITGQVVDGKSQESLVGVTILVVEKEAVGAATDLDGQFVIDDLEIGTYSLRVSAIGYETRIVTNVVVSTGRQATVYIPLEQKTFEMDEVVVESSNYFEETKEFAPLSARQFDRTEVLRSPGAVQDVQRVVQGLPGVASSTDNINELIVRGGAPFENLTIIDYMEVPSINHYSSQENSAGAINMINADMLRDAKFSSGGFPAQYGDKSSSVLNLSIREGNFHERFASKTGFTMAGLGTVVEGSFANGNASYIASARQSLLQVVDNLVGLSTISLTAVPKYWDTQAKVVYRLGSDRKLSFNVLYGESKINIIGNPEAQDELRANRTDSISVEHVFPFNRQYVGGLNYLRTYGNKGYGVWTLYAVGNEYEVEVNSDFARQERGSSGEVLNYDILSSRPVFNNNSDESFMAAKYNLVYNIAPRHELSAGGQWLTVTQWKNNVWISPDTLRYDLNGDGTYETGPVVIPEGSIRQTLNFGDASKLYAYVSDKMQVSKRLSGTVGARFDYFSYSRAYNLSPRLSVTYQITSGSSLTFAGGRYHQTHPLINYGDRREIGYNKKLDNMYADHAILGFEKTLKPGLRVSAEAYVKDYHKVAVSENHINQADTTFWSDRLLTEGRRLAYGIEFFLEQKQVKDFFGTLSVSLSKTRVKDPRIPRVTDWYTSGFDYPLIISAQGGHVINGFRKWLDRTPFFIKYPTYILPFSDDMEISFKYRYQSGRTYTPREFVRWKQFREGELSWSEGTWVSTDDINGERYPAYQRVDLQWLSRFPMKRMNLNVYVMLLNVFDRKNVFFRSYRSDGTVDTVYQFRFFPVGGLEIEF